MGPADDDAEPDAAPSGQTPGPASPPVAGPAEEPLDRRRLILLCTPIVVLVVMTQINSILFWGFVDDQPLLLEILSANNRNLVNAAAKLPFITYAVVAFVRLLAPDPFFFELGWHYGDRTLRWLERRTPTVGQMMRQLETWFGTLGWLFVLVFPNNYVCAIAGSARMRRGLFWTLNVIGTIGRILVLWWVGQTFQEWVDAVTGWMGRYRWPLLAASVALFVVTTGREWRAGTSDVQQVVDLEHELEDADDEPR